EFGLGYGSNVVVLAGPGNNGGDAYVVADVLSRRGVGVALVPFGEPQSPAARAHARKVTRFSSTVPASPDLIVDGVFGAGSRPGLPAAVAEWAQVNAPVLSLDLPSGLEADTGTAGAETMT